MNSIQAEAGQVIVGWLPDMETVTLGVVMVPGFAAPKVAAVELKPDQLSAVIFALEMAAEDARFAKERKAAAARESAAQGAPVICRGDALCTVPAACITPLACDRTA
ncbi:hypothetical protein AZ34_10335 [Hylemonella gracilis str. Niagara R]|uniref:Uncharacterized protein n=1 Tax=Hylemonella gracilis str. Niagara R TaxID=1458275 RepID=A0A016XLZ5_9BURK|nr:hypothetical protein [Hylemonella gracilis]EYC52866.1 hypothetical protein AZ34_10335 [Hylemonella gracilis str. Niagara R]